MTKSIEEDVFDRKTRDETLKSGQFTPPSGTLFEAIFHELKRKEEQEKNKHSLSDMISKIHFRDTRK